MELSSAIRRAIRRDEPIEVDGITLYPIRVAEYEEFLTARPAIEVMQRTFPVRLLSVPLLQALYTMDLEAVEAGQAPSGLFYRALLFLALALRLGVGEEADARVKKFHVVIDPQDPKRLKGLRCVVNGMEQVEITPVLFQRMRPILAAQNGMELVGDEANPDLVQAERDIAAAKGPKLEVTLEALLSVLCTLTGCEEAEAEEWTVRKLNSRREAVNRVLNFLICGIGESQGTKWKGGNPYPSPFFDRVREDSPALIAMDKFAGGKGLEAMQHLGGAPPMGPPVR